MAPYKVKLYYEVAWILTCFHKSCLFLDCLWECNGLSSQVGVVCQPRTTELPYSKLCTTLPPTRRLHCPVSIHGSCHGGLQWVLTHSPLHYRTRFTWQFRFSQIHSLLLSTRLRTPLPSHHYNLSLPEPVVPLCSCHIYILYPTRNTGIRIRCLICTSFK